MGINGVLYQFILSIPTWTLWVCLFIIYTMLDGIGAKNIIATNKLSRLTASNTSAMMYVLGVIGSYICVTRGINNIIPIALGAWVGTFTSITWEIKILKKNGRSKRSKK